MRTTLEPRRRVLANMFSGRACAEGVTIEQMCRLGRTAAELERTAGLVGRALVRSQQMPVPFYGTVVQDEVDAAAVDRAWGGRGVQQSGGGTRSDGEAAEVADGPGGPKDGPVPLGMAGSTPGTSAPPGHARWQAPVGQGLPAMTIGEIGEGGGDGGVADGGGVGVDGGVGGDGGGGDGGGGVGGGGGGGDCGGNDTVQSPAADAEPAAAVTPLKLPADGKVWAQPRRSSDAAPRPGRDGGAAPKWTTTRLEQGPGWTLDVVRPPAGGKADAGGARGPGA